MIFSSRKYFITAFILFVISFSIHCLSSPAAGAPLPGAFDFHSIDVRLDLMERRILGKDTITFAEPAAAKYRLLVDKNIHIERVELARDSSPLPFTIQMPHISRTETTVKELIITAPAQSKAGPVTIYFNAVISPVESARKWTERGVSFSGISVMGREGAFLPSSSFWFPRRPAPFAFYDLVVSLPLGFKAVMEGELLERNQTESRSVLRFKTNTPCDGINLVAARFVVKSERYKGIDIYTYFYSDDEKLSRTYIDKTKFYIDAYEERFAPYPYKKFAVVENFLPTGFGMPSFTLLGSTVLRLPFIPDTSLGHEFAHNWWGNGVFIDATTGNWAEALATYTADHWFKEKEGPAASAAYRMRALGNYANYASSSEMAVSSFAFSTSTEARAIGYSKAMMIFHMLRGLVGDELFYRSLKKFYTDNAFTNGSWEDIRHAFEDTSKRDLRWFFDQWLTRSGGPRLSIEEPGVSQSGPAFTITLVIRQEPPVYRLKVPLMIETAAGERRRVVVLNKESQEIKIELGARPLSIELDPETDIFRLLSPAEIPPSLATVLGNKESVLVLPSGYRSHKKYQLIADKIQRDFALEIIEDTRVTDEELLGGSSSYFILGDARENKLFDKIKEMLPEGLDIGDGYFMVDEVLYDSKDSVLVAALSVGDKRRTVALLFGGLSEAELERIGARVSHLTSKGFLVFTRGGGLKHGTFEGKKSLRYDFAR